MAAFFSQKQDVIDEGLIRHLVLNTIRSYNVKYRQKYGELIIACDGGSWRKKVFPEYKAGRKTSREESPVDWGAVWDIFGKISEEISEQLPYKVIKVKGAEADDVIATLVETTQEFGNSEAVMIISADKDFIQLQKYKNVSQFSPMTRKLVSDKNPRRYLHEHIFRGCGGDGVPNVLSPDNVFVNPNGRQKPLKQKIIDLWCDNYFSALKEHMEPDVQRNFIRNQTCIDLSYIPSEISNEILQEYDRQPCTPNSKVLSYLISKRCKNLIGCANDFFLFKP